MLEARGSFSTCTVGVVDKVWVLLISEPRMSLLAVKSGAVSKGCDKLTEPKSNRGSPRVSEYIQFSVAEEFSERNQSPKSEVTSLISPLSVTVVDPLDITVAADVTVFFKFVTAIARVISSWP